MLSGSGLSGEADEPCAGSRLIPVVVCISRMTSGKFIRPEFLRGSSHFRNGISQVGECVERQFRCRLTVVVFTRCRGRTDGSNAGRKQRDFYYIQSE